MSWQPAIDPEPGDAFACDAIAAVIVPRARDLGGFSVRRALPSTQCQMVGPFIFFDQMGPAEFRLGAGMDVRPHPHIGLSTVTYLFEGEIIHQRFPRHRAAHPAGRAELDDGRARYRAFGTDVPGIALGRLETVRHSELDRARGEDEETLPDLVHYEASELPELSGEGKLTRVIAGSVLGASSPVWTSSPMFYADVRLSLGASLPLDLEYEERAIYTVVGEVEIAGDVFGPAQLLVFRPGDRITIWAKTNARSCCWAGSRWMGRGTFGGISCRRDASVSSRPKPIGRWVNSDRFWVTTNSFRSRSLTPPRSLHPPLLYEPSLVA